MSKDFEPVVRLGYCCEEARYERIGRMTAATLKALGAALLMLLFVWIAAQIMMHRAEATVDAPRPGPVCPFGDAAQRTCL